jgi:hypothetical protein
LRDRKRELLLESELNRHVVRVEVGRIRCRVDVYRRRYGWAQSAWKWAVPVAGFLLARKFKNTAGVFAKGSMLLGAARSLWGYWTSRQDRDGPPSADNGADAHDVRG